MTADLPIRSATPADVDAIVDLIADRIGDEDALEARLVLEDPTFDMSRWTVATDSGRVVSTMASFAAEVGVGAAEMAGTMIEFVATARQAEGRGLVRRQLDAHHGLAAGRRELVQVIVGIPYYYRRFGYELAVPISGYRTVTDNEIPFLPRDWSVRDANAGDLTPVRSLQRLTALEADFRVMATHQMWSWYLDSPAYAVRVAEHEGSVAAAWRTYDGDEPLLLDLATSEAAGVAAAISDAADDRSVAVLARPGLASQLSIYGTFQPSSDAYYVRIADPAVFLDALRPELERRLAASAFADAQGEVLISLYTSSIRFGYAAGEIGPIEHGPGIQAPVSAGGSGVPPDHFAALALGPLSVGELDGRHPDFLPGEQRAALDALFPKMTADVQSWVAP